jgi:group II intron reverse transcriptase/maturase
VRQDRPPAGTCHLWVRPGRRTQDAIAEIHYLASRSYEWVVEADIEACFDRIDHQALMGRVRERIADKRVLALIKAFVPEGRIMTEHGDREVTLTGTPQGGILSPLLANIALSALDDDFARAWAAMGTNSGQRQRRRQRGEPTYRLVRYADDFVILVAGERQHAAALTAHTQQVLAPLGLTLSAEKTRVVHIDEGFEFLGFAIKRCRGRHGHRHVYTYPSKPSLAAVKMKVKAITRTGHDQTLDQLLHRLNPVLRGWCAYFRHGVSKRTFNCPRLHMAAGRLLAAPQIPQGQLALDAGLPPSRLVAHLQRHRALQPRRRSGHPLRLPALRHQLLELGRRCGLHERREGPGRGPDTFFQGRPVGTAGGRLPAAWRNHALAAAQHRAHSAR